MAPKEIGFVHVFNRTPSEVVLAASDVIIFVFESSTSVIDLTMSEHLCFLTLCLVPETQNKEHFPCTGGNIEGSLEGIGLKV